MLVAGCYSELLNLTTPLGPFMATAQTRATEEISILREPPRLVQETDRKCYRTKNLYFIKYFHVLKSQLSIAFGSEDIARQSRHIRQNFGGQIFGPSASFM